MTEIREKKEESREGCLSGEEGATSTSAQEGAKNVLLPKNVASHLRNNSMSQLDNLIVVGKENEEVGGKTDTPEKVYSLEDDQIEYSPRPKTAREPRSISKASNRRKVSLDRHSTSILEKANHNLNGKLKTIPSLREGEGDLKLEDEIEASPSFEKYIVSEFGMVEHFSDFNEGILDLNERERVYNTLIYVPMQYERMLLFGLLLCLDSFLSLLTFMPLRAVYILYLYVCKLYKKESVGILSLLKQASAKIQRPPRTKTKGKNKSSKNNSNLKKKEEKEEDKEAFRQTLPDYLCDILWLALIVLCCCVLLQMKTSEAFHYIHAQEVIKLYVVLTMLEIFDKIVGSLSFDCLETLASSCSMLLGGRSARGGQEYPGGSKGDRADVVRVTIDFFVSLLVMCIHCFIIMLEAITFNVVLNSAHSSLLALLVSNNFAELKGTVFKNMNVTRLWTLSMQDIVEHFHISICLAFVLIENMMLTNANFPSYKIAKQCAMILITEIVVDIMKHAFVGKFQNLKPGVYSEYLKDMCEKTVASSSINGYRIVKFNPLVPASILLRIVIPLLRRFWQRSETLASQSFFLLAILSFWVVLFALKLVIGWSLQVIAQKYLKYYSTTRKTKPKPWLLSSRKPLEKTQ
jgi:hypothetical protein